MKTSAEEGPLSLQLGVLRLGLLQDGDVGVGVFPEGEEVLVGGAGLGSVAAHRVGSTELKVCECTQRKVLYHAAMVEQLLELRSRRCAIVRQQVGLTAQIGWV
jgi:hypothetical protein